MNTDSKDNNPKVYHSPINIILNFDTIINAKKSIKKINKKYVAGNIPDPMYRNLIYMLSQSISLLKLEKDIEIEKRLEELENKINEQLHK